MTNKFIKILSIILTIACLCTILVSCGGNISESYAEKINKAAEKDEFMTYEQVMDDLGDNAIEITFLKSGVILAVKGCKSVSDIQAKMDAGEKIKGIVITVLAGKATGAQYREITEKDLKK